MKEYLPQLTTRKNWATEKKRQMEVGDFVLVCDKQCHPFSYPIRRILELHTGDDEVSRSVTVRANQGHFKRPLVNLVPLEIDGNNMFLETKNKAGDVAVGD